MARLVTSGFETGAFTTEPGYASLIGAPTLQGVVVNSGAAALAASGGTAAAMRYSAPVALGGTAFHRVYFRISALPTALFDVAWIEFGGGSPAARLRLTTAGKLQLWDSTVQIGADSATLSLDTQYVLEIAAESKVTAGTAYVEGRINGVSFATSAVANTGGSTITGARVGHVSSTAFSGTVYIDDVAINDATTGSNNSWPGTGALPANTVLPAIAGATTRGTLLACSPGTWTNTPIAYSYQWQRSPIGGGAWADIAGAATAQYVLVAADVGKIVRCRVAATNLNGSALALSLASATIASGLAPLDALAYDDYRVVNWYPVANPGPALWTAFDITTVGPDMANIAGLNANMVRIFLDYPAFGDPPSAAKLNQLEQVITLAEAHGLHIWLTLFDGTVSYATPAAHHTWVANVLTPYIGDPRITVVEVRNEVDYTDATAAAWATNIGAYIKSLAGGWKVTTSVADPLGIVATSYAAMVTAMAGIVDFYSIHLFDKLERCYGTIKQCQAIAGPVFVGETGFTSYSTYSYQHVPTGTNARLAYQDFWYRCLFAVCRAAGVPKPGVWVLNEFALAAGFGGVEQHYYGLFDLTGAEKPAAPTVREYFGGNVIDRSYNGGFEQVADAPIPADVLNLSKLRIDLPIDAAGGFTGVELDITQPELAGYIKPPYFYVAGSSVVLAAPSGGAKSSGTTFARCEFREMADTTGSHLASWGIADGVTHTLIVTMTSDVHQLVVKPRVVVGQIHDATSTPPIKLTVNNTLSTPGLAVELNSSTQSTRLIAHLADGAEFTYKIVCDAVNGIRIYAALGDASMLPALPQYTFPASSFLAASRLTGCYFKAGSYVNTNPSNGEDPAAIGSVAISALSVTHV